MSLLQEDLQKAGKRHIPSWVSLLKSWLLGHFSSFMDPVPKTSHTAESLNCAELNKTSMAAQGFAVGDQRVEDLHLKNIQQQELMSFRAALTTPADTTT